MAEALLERPARVAPRQAARSRRRIAAGLAIAIAVAAGAAGFAGGRGGGEPRWTLAGETVAGERLSLGDFRGSVVVLNVWASWCPPCRTEKPALERLWREQRGNGVAVVGVNAGDTRAEALAFHDEYGITYPSLFDPSSSLRWRIGARLLPSTFVLDATGRVVYSRYGPVEDASLRAAITAAARSRG